jgi:transposase
MARYKHYDLNQSKMIPLSYADQIVEGSFEFALNEIVEEHLDLSVFEHRYRNDATGRSAYDPKVLLKVVLYGYCRGIVSSRRIAEACRRNVVFMALSADSRPHFTTIAAFVSSLEHEIASLFGDVLLYASELGLIGKEHFAVDGCKLPSNASKKWSGTHKELEEKHKKLERVAERIVQRHRERDSQERDGVGAGAEPEKAKYYRRKVTSSGCCAISVNLSSRQNARRLVTRPISNQRCCGAGSASSTDRLSDAALNHAFCGLVGAKVRLVGQVRRDFVAANPGSFVKRGLRSALAFDDDGQVHLNCNSPCSAKHLPPLLVRLTRSGFPLVAREDPAER